MNQDEFVAAIKKQQSLIRKLFSNRKRRSEVIDEVTQERYGHLVGRFFRPQGDHFKGACDVDHYICGISTCSSYLMSDEVFVEVDCRYINKSYCGTNMCVVGFDTGHQSFRFNPGDNLDDILAGLWVPMEKAFREMDAAYQDFKKYFLRKSSSDQKE